MEVRNGQFHVLDSVMVTVTRLDTWMIPKGQIVDLDRMNSFTLQIISGETRMKAPDLTALLNQYLFPHAKAPIGNITVTFEGGGGKRTIAQGDRHSF